MTTAIANCDSKFCNHDAPSSRPAKPRLTHGIEPFTEEHDRRVTLHWQVANPWTEQAVMPPFTAADLEYTPYLPEQSTRDVGRRLATVSLIAGQHEARHWFWTHPFCVECRGDEKATHRSLETWMTLHPGKDVPLGNDALPELAVEQEAPEVTDEFLAIPKLRALALTSRKWWVGGIIPQGRHGIMSGRDGTFKSFAAFDLALHIAVGLDWHEDRRVESGRVLYLAGEGVQSFGDRLASWEAEYGELDELEEENVTVRNGTVDLHGGTAEYDRLLAYVREWRPVFIVIDTLQRSAGSADQNSASDMAVIRQRIHELQKAGAEGCTTMVVAHTDKGDNDTRGSSSIEDDSDFVLHCRRKDKELDMKVPKQKDGPDGFTVELGVRTHGESLAVVDRKKTPGIVEDGLDGARAVRAVLSMAFGTDPLTKRATWQAVLADTTYGKSHTPSETSVGRYITQAMEQGWVVEADKIGKSTRYAVHTDHLPEGHPRKTHTENKEA